MAMNIKDEKVERVAEELAHLTGESKTAVILQLANALDFLEKEIWGNIPRHLLGQPVTKSERERILGYGQDGV